MTNGTFSLFSHPLLATGMSMERHLSLLFITAVPIIKMFACPLSLSCKALQQLCRLPRVHSSIQPKIKNQFPREQLRNRYCTVVINSNNHHENVKHLSNAERSSRKHPRACARARTQVHRLPRCGEFRKRVVLEGSAECSCLSREVPHIRLVHI
jgi:hypothetical protein